MIYSRTASNDVRQAPGGRSPEDQLERIHKFNHDLEMFGGSRNKLDRALGGLKDDYNGNLTGDVVAKYQENGLNAAVQFVEEVRRDLADE